MFLHTAGSRVTTAALAFALYATTPATLQGQDTNRVARPPQRQETKPISAAMLRVLAEAADVHRTGQPVYLVADYRYPHNVLGPFASARAAERVRADSGSKFGVFGPYVTPADERTDSTAKVVALRMVLQTPGGRADTIDVDPKVDALFLTQSAVDKFMIPYYGRTYGPEYAVKLEGLTRKVPRPKCHIGSLSCFPAPDGSIEIIRVLGPTGQPPTGQPPR